MDTMVMPSLFEGLCLVALEAQANGIPIVISDKFSIETKVADNVFMLPLEYSAYKWAEYIYSLKGSKREYNEQKLKDKGFTFEHMMEEIRKILIR